MAIPKVKATYSLDVATVRTLEETARRWGVSKSEVLRRAVQAVGQRGSGVPNDALRALDELQEAQALTDGKATSWARNVRRERRAYSSRREPRTS